MKHGPKIMTGANYKKYPRKYGLSIKWQEQKLSAFVLHDYLGSFAIFTAQYV